LSGVSWEEGRRKKEEGRRKREEGRRKREIIAILIYEKWRRLLACCGQDARATFTND